MVKKRSVRSYIIDLCTNLSQNVSKRPEKESNSANTPWRDTCDAWLCAHSVDIRQPAARRRWLWLYGSVGTQRARDLAEKTRLVSWCRKLDVDVVFPHTRIISLHVTLYDLNLWAISLQGAKPLEVCRLMILSSWRVWGGHSVHLDHRKSLWRRRLVPRLSIAISLVSNQFSVKLNLIQS